MEDGRLPLRGCEQATLLCAGDCALWNKGETAYSSKFLQLPSATEMLTAVSAAVSLVGHSSSRPQCFWVLVPSASKQPANWTDCPSGSPERKGGLWVSVEPGRPGFVPCSATASCVALARPKSNREFNGSQVPKFL